MQIAGVEVVDKKDKTRIVRILKDTYFAADIESARHMCMEISDVTSLFELLGTHYAAAPLAHHMYSGSIIGKQFAVIPWLSEQRNEYTSGEASFHILLHLILIFLNHVCRHVNQCKSKHFTVLFQSFYQKEQNHAQRGQSRH